MRIGRVGSLHRYPVKSMGGETLGSVEVTARGFERDRQYALRDEVRREIRGAKNWPVLLMCSSRYEGDRIVIRLPEGRELSVGDSGIDAALSELVGVKVTLRALEPAENREHYRRRIPGSRFAGTLARSKTVARGLQKMMAATGMDRELREQFGREPGEPLPDLSVFSNELFEFVSPLGTYFDAYPIHILSSATLAALRAKRPDATWDPRRFRPNVYLEMEPEASSFVENDWSGRELRVGDVIFELEALTPRCSMVLQAQPGLEREPQILRTIVHEAKHNVGIYANVKRAGRINAGDEAVLL